MENEEKIFLQKKMKMKIPSRTKDLGKFLILQHLSTLGGIV